jgi:hypothetical protein
MFRTARVTQIVSTNVSGTYRAAFSPYSEVGRDDAVGNDCE